MKNPEFWKHIWDGAILVLHFSKCSVTVFLSSSDIEAAAAAAGAAFTHFHHVMAYFKYFFLCYFYLVYFRHIRHPFRASIFFFGVFVHSSRCTVIHVFFFFYGNSGHFVVRYRRQGKNRNTKNIQRIKNNDDDDDDVRFLTICYYYFVFVISVVFLLSFCSFFFLFLHLLPTRQ